MFLLYAQIALLALLPLSMSAAASAWAWGTLSKPWLYVVCATAGSYAIYGALMYLLDPDRGRGAGYMVSANDAATTPETRYQVTTVNGEVLSYFLQPYLLRMVIFALISLPLLRLLARLLRR